MSKIITASICLSKIDKSKIVLGKDGVTKYLNIQVSVNDTKDQYGNDSAIWINQSKEEREQKQAKQYLGNGKVTWTNEGAPVENTATPVPVSQPADDLPF